MNKLVLTAALAAAPFSANAQTAAPVAPSNVPIAPVVSAKPIAAPSASQQILKMPANTEVLLSLNDDITSKRAEEGDKFYLTVVHDVTYQGFIVIPKGTRAVGEVTWRTGKGAFGKSGKLEVEMRYIDLPGQAVPVVGKFRQEGEGNTVATVAAVATVWVAAPFITGKSGRIPRGREFVSHTQDALPFVVDASAVAAPSVVAAPVASIVVPAK
jgi:hypothetical protein